jgi:DNA-binding HxlR family transcriptional regulator
MPSANRTYDHFCTLARALEQVGDRWTLLIVRDLLDRGPRRFTDLLGLLGGITPKTLTQRLRELAEAGIVEVDRAPGRREVWYSLTPAGHELRPIVEGLMLWGLRHARRPPQPREAVHAEHLLNAVRIVLDRTRPPGRPVTWRFDIVDDAAHVLAFDGTTWSVRAARPDDVADVVVEATTAAWADYLLTPPRARTLPRAGLQVTGASRDVQAFVELVGRFPNDVDAP